MPLSLSGYYRR